MSRDGLRKRGASPAEGGKKKVKVPEGLWVKCDRCGDIVFREEMERNLFVCAKCNYHHYIDARLRISSLLDEGTFIEHDVQIEPVDAIGFKDTMTYKKRLALSQKMTALKDAIICGEGLIKGMPVMVGAFEFKFMGGSMGSVVGEKITRLFERAMEGGYPVVIFSSSGGARMQEGILSLMQMAKTSSVIARFKEGRNPFISILTNPTMGGVSASFAMLGDVIIAEPEALVGFAGPRVIKQTIRESLPGNFQRSEYLLEYGMIDLIAARKEISEVIQRVLKMLK